MRTPLTTLYDESGPADGSALSFRLVVSYANALPRDRWLSARRYVGKRVQGGPTIEAPDACALAYKNPAPDVQLRTGAGSMYWMDAPVELAFDWLIFDAGNQQLLVAPLDP